MAMKKPKQKKRSSIALTAEDEKIVKELMAKKGIVSFSDLIREGFRKLAEFEGLR